MFRGYYAYVLRVQSAMPNLTNYQAPYNCLTVGIPVNGYYGYNPGQSKQQAAGI